MSGREHAGGGEDLVKCGGELRRALNDAIACGGGGGMIEPRGGGGMGNKQGAIGTNSLGGFESSSSSSSSSSQRGNGTDSNKQKERGWDNPPQPIYRTGGREGGMAVLPYQRAERRPPPDLPQARRRGDEEEGGGGGGGSWAILWTGEATRNRGRDETRREDMRRDGGGGDDDGRWGGGGQGAAWRRDYRGAPGGWGLFTRGNREGCGREAPEWISATRAVWSFSWARNGVGLPRAAAARYNHRRAWYAKLFVSSCNLFKVRGGERWPV
jgi:hypothetical protein